jgi:hypothetical protein
MDDNLVTHVLYRAAGAPEMQGEQVGTCRTCGATGVGESFTSWVRDTFTDHDKLLAGDIICHACQFAFTDTSAQLTARMGKDKLQRMRNYSHFVVAGEWVPLSKAEKARMAEILLRQHPTVAVVAVSGQKHIIFRAKPGWWQIEEHTARPFEAALSDTLQLVERLYNGGISKTEIETGRYSQRRALEFGLSAFLAAEAAIRPLRGSLQLELALFLAQREDTDGQVRDGKEPDSTDLARRPGRLQEPVQAQHLGAVRGQHQKRGVHGHAEQVRQQSLFEIAGDDPA